ncbi:hypothetical protein GJ496_004037 [Pomphorhynchus laevis]|nr:hypothetical protein GJ496_004037 [Pomphorhynchus laevis]
MLVNKCRHWRHYSSMCKNEVNLFIVQIIIHRTITPIEMPSNRANCGGAHKFNNHRSYLPRYLSPAKNAVCKSCKKNDHYAIVCRSKPRNIVKAIQTEDDQRNPEHEFPLMTMLSAVPSAEPPDTRIEVKIKQISFHTMIDTGSAENFIRTCITNTLGLYKTSYITMITMASSKHCLKITHCWNADMNIHSVCYQHVRLFCHDDICTDLILGRPFLIQEGLDIPHDAPDDQNNAYVYKYADNVKKTPNEEDILLADHTRETKIFRSSS